jgi:hypothetical protein
VCVCVSVSLENVVCDVKECQRGMDLSWREYSMHGHNPLLKDFISKHETRLQKLQEDAHIAQARKHTFTHTHIHTHARTHTGTSDTSKCYMTVVTTVLHSPVF